MKTKKTVAAVHAAPIFMQTDATIDKVIDFIREGGSQGVEFMVFPEVFVPGYPYWANAFAPATSMHANIAYATASIEVPGPEIARVQAACRTARVAIALGISERMRDTRTCFNTQVFIDGDGTLLGIHRKLQPTYYEKMVWAQGGGATLRTFRSQVGVIGGLVCSEHTLYAAKQSYIDQHQQIHAASWPSLSCLVGFDMFDGVIEGMARSHAYGAQVFVITSSNFVDQHCLDWIAQNVGEQQVVRKGGGWSAITHPLSTHLGGPATGEGEKLLVAEVDFGDLDFAKLLLDGAGHYSRPEIVKTHINFAPLWPDESKLDGRFPVEDTRVVASDVSHLP